MEFRVPIGQIDLLFKKILKQYHFNYSFLNQQGTKRTNMVLLAKLSRGMAAVQSFKPR